MAKQNKEGIELLSSFFLPINDQGKNRYIPLPNIADELDDNLLSLIGKHVVEGYQADWDSMEEWRNNIEFGKDISKQERNAKNDPWQNASNFKSPVLMNAALKFSDTTSTQILRGRELVKADITGKDKDNLKKERADRVAEFMNYQLNVEMPEWRDEQEKLIYDIPYSGTVFKKTFYDSEEGRNNTKLICYPDFAVNQSATSMDRLPRFTEIFELNANQVLEKQNAGIWLDVNLGEDGEGDDEAPSDKIREFIEQHGTYDIDGDGYEEPYTFVVHVNTEKVVRIIPRFDPENAIVKSGNANITLANVIDNGGTGEIVRIKANNNITKYGFLHDPNGEFLDVGYCYLLGALTCAINATTNQLVDAGTLANLSGGYLAKNFRKRLGRTTFKPGHWEETNLSPQDLQSGMFPHPHKEPSATLFSLNQFLIANAQELSASADLGSALGPQTAPTTALAIIDEQLQKTGAVVLRIYRSMAREFSKLYELNAKFVDPVQYVKVVDDENADFRSDFEQEGMDIIPIANPEVSSKIQRIQMASAEMSQIEMVAAAGGDIRPIIKNFYEAIGTQYVDDIFPEESPLDMIQRILSENPDIAALIMQEQERLDLIAAAQADAYEREQQRQDIRLAADIDKIAAETENKQADTIKKLEEAETEQTKNQIDTYTAAQNIDNLALQNQRQAQELSRDNERRVPAVETTESD